MFGTWPRIFSSVFSGKCKGFFGQGYSFSQERTGIFPGHNTVLFINGRVVLGAGHGTGEDADLSNWERTRRKKSFF